jgi:hypothetical protein
VPGITVDEQHARGIGQVGPAAETEALLGRSLGHLQLEAVPTGG